MMLRRCLAVVVAVLSLCGSAQSQTLSRSVILFFDRESDIASQWFFNGRQGALDGLTPYVGSHTTSPYISDAVLASVDQAYRRQSSTLLRSRQTDVLPLFAVLRYEAVIAPATIAAKLRSVPGVRHAEPLAEYRLVETPNDPDLSRQTHIDVIRAVQAWDFVPQGASIVVGIVDTGLDTAHVDLNENLWRNPGETGVDAFGVDKRFNNVDDDNNGFVDDWFGWDFVGADGETPDNTPLPGNAHGTHVAGIVGAVINNGAGGVGVANRVKLMPVKIGRDNPSATTVSRSAEAILYAAANGAAIINCSFGSPSQSFADESVIREATALGALVVGAAGNDRRIAPFYPAAYDQAVSVGATRDDDRLAGFTNLHSTIDVCAPGVAVYSTVPGNAYDFLDGTSMASPVVAGIAAMVRQRFPAYSTDQVRAALMASCDAIDSLNGIFFGLYGSGRVNAERALSSAAPRWASIFDAVVTDYDEDNVLRPGDTAYVSFTLKNELSSANNIVVRISTAPAAFSPIILADSVVVGAMGTGETRRIDSLIRVVLPTEVPYDGELRLMALIIADGTQAGRQLITSNVNPTFVTISANDITTTVNSRGNIGFNDYSTNLQGVGLLYKNGSNLLFEGGILIGTGPRNLPNAVRGGTPSQKDTSFHPLSVAELRTDSVPSGARVTANYADIYDDFGLGLKVRQVVYALTADSVKNVVFQALTIRNTSDSTFRDLYVSEFFDVDIGPAGAYNGCAWDPSNGIGLFQNTRVANLPSVGVAMISSLPVNFFAIDNPGDLTSPNIYDNFLRAEKWLVMTGGVRRANSRITDVSACIGAGPLALAPGEEKQIVFAISAAEDYNGVRDAINSARRVGSEMGLNTGPFVQAPTEDAIVHFSGGPLCVPGSQTVIFRLASPSFAQLELTDLFGSVLATAFYNPYMPSGQHSVEITVPNAASGTYFLVLRTVGSTISLPFGIAQ